MVANVAALGGRSAVAGVVGTDAAGNHLLAALRAAGAYGARCCACELRPSRRRASSLTISRWCGSTGKAAASWRGRCAGGGAAAVLARLRRADVLIVSDYGKGVIEVDLLEQLAAAHERRPFTWVVDPKGVNFSHYRRASLVKPNLMEAAHASGIEIRGPDTLRRAGQALLERWDTEAVLISRGEAADAVPPRRRRARFRPPRAGVRRDGGGRPVATCALALGAGGSLEDATRRQPCRRHRGRQDRYGVSRSASASRAGGTLMRSMTGFGAGAADTPGAHVAVEVRGERGIWRCGSGAARVRRLGERCATGCARASSAAVTSRACRARRTALRIRCGTS